MFFLSAEEVRKAAYGFIDDNARIANYGDSAADGGFVLLTENITLQAWSTLPVVCVLNG